MNAWNAGWIAAVAVSLGVSLAASPALAEEIDAKGAVTDEFFLGPATQSPSFNIGAVIERDRMYMSARPGFHSKHLPFAFEANGVPSAGGFYLFDEAADAVAFADWVAEDFALDGVLILDRDYFIAPVAFHWQVIGAHAFGGVDEQLIVRTERWRTPAHDVTPLLRAIYPLVRLNAWWRGHTAVWLLYNADERLVNVVYYGDRVAPPGGPAPDVASLEALASQPTMGLAFLVLGWPKTFDRTSWVMTHWFPFVAGDAGAPALWSFSPPFPQPFEGDGLCVPSRGESHATTADCPPTCGDGVPQAGETTANCPGDVPL